MTRMLCRYRRLSRKLAIGLKVLTLTPQMRRPPYLSPELCAEIGKALEAADRDETVNLGDFTQYADED